MTGPDRVVGERGRVGAGAAWMRAGRRLAKQGSKLGHRCETGGGNGETGCQQPKARRARRKRKTRMG